ncbi:MAG: glycosyl hydrolase-related protein, partial [Candidatus Bathyarchaeota archaeon]|nr:glycosyl hydrolase-related protein [Candidatus Bathyarchaeota archaeon]
VLEREEHGSMGEEKSLINVKPDNIVVSCFKEAENGDALVVRVYDASGKGASAEIQFYFNVEEAYEADLMEEPTRLLKVLDDNKIRLEINPFEIKTLLIKPS